MAGSATWREKCPSCQNTGKIRIFDKITKDVSSATIDCPCCDGRGFIFIKKLILRKKS